MDLRPSSSHTPSASYVKIALDLTLLLFASGLRKSTVDIAGGKGSARLFWCSCCLDSWPACGSYSRVTSPAPGPAARAVPQHSAPAVLSYPRACSGNDSLAPGSGNVCSSSSAQTPTVHSSLQHPVVTHLSLKPRDQPSWLNWGLWASMVYETFCFKLGLFSDKPWQVHHPVGKSPDLGGLVTSVRHLLWHLSCHPRRHTQVLPAWHLSEFSAMQWTTAVILLKVQISDLGDEGGALPWAYYLSPRHSGCSFYLLHLYCLEFLYFLGTNTLLL